MSATLPSETPRLLLEWRQSHRPPLSQIKAADKLGVALRNFTRWEKGEHYPQLRSIEKIAPKMGLEVQDFYPVGEETPAATRERIARMEEILDALADAILSPAQRKWLTKTQERALGPLPQDAAEVGSKRRATRNGVSSRRAQGRG